MSEVPKNATQLMMLWTEFFQETAGEIFTSDCLDLKTGWELF